MIDVIEELQLELERIRKKNKKFSLRAYSRKLGMPTSTLSDLLNRKRPTSPKMALRVAKALKLQPYGSALHECQPLKPLGDGEVQALVSWVHFAILAMIELRGFKSNHAWIAKKLDVPVAQVQLALADLKSLGLVKDKGGHLSVLNTLTIPKNPIKKSYIKNHISQTIELTQKKATDEIREFDVNDLPLTLALDSRNLKFAEDSILKFKKKFCKKMNQGKKDQVYQLAVFLYPVSQKVDD